MALTHQAACALNSVQKHTGYVLALIKTKACAVPPASQVCMVESDSVIRIQSRLFLQAGLEHTVSSSLPSRWGRERPGLQGQTRYLKPNDYAEIRKA